MKQGTGNNSMGATKIEPKSTAINPGAVANIGIQNVRTIPQPMHAGRGFSAPSASSTSHHTGSQGKR
jgi:hypothetical protein